LNYRESDHQQAGRYSKHVSLLPFPEWETYGRADKKSFLLSEARQAGAERTASPNNQRHMCHQCDKYILTDLDIKDSDLPYLPYKLVKWTCCMPGCKCGTSIRDYGLGDYYYWPVKVRRMKNGWRGGWMECSHWYLCSRHYKLFQDRQLALPYLNYKLAKSKFTSVAVKK